MDNQNRTSFSRVTVLAPGVRVDVALPSDVAIADLMPNLFDLTGVAAGDGGAGHGGWGLSRIGEPELDASRSLAGLGVTDGVLLHLRPRTERPPAPIFDDVVDAIAATTAETNGLWDRRLGHHLGLGLAALAFVLTGVALLQAAEQRTAVQFGGGLAVLLIAIGASIARARGDLPTAVVVAAGALPLAAAAGLRGTGEFLTMDSLLLGSSALFVASVLALVAVGAGGAVFLTGATVGLLAGLACLLGTVGNHPGLSVAAGTICVAIGLLLFVPRLGARLAALPLPLVPTSAADLTDEPDPDFQEVVRRTVTAQGYLTGMYAGIGVVVLACVLQLFNSDNGWARLLAVVCTGVLLLRSRALSRTPHVLALLLSGSASALGLLLFTSTRVGSDLAEWVPVAGVLLAGLALLLGVVFPRRRFAPGSRRLVDALEALLIVTLLPVALAVMDLYDAFRRL